MYMIPLNETTKYIISWTANTSQNHNIHAVVTSLSRRILFIQGWTNILHKTLGCMEITTKNPKNNGKTTKHQLVYTKLDLHCRINASSMMLRTTAKSSEPLSCHWPMASDWNRFQPQKTRKFCARKNYCEGLWESFNFAWTSFLLKLAKACKHPEHFRITYT